MKAGHPVITRFNYVVHFRLLTWLMAEGLSRVHHTFMCKIMLCYLLKFLFTDDFLHHSPTLVAGDIPLQRGHHVHQQHVPSFCSSPLHWVHPLLQGEPTDSVCHHIFGFDASN